MIRFKVATCLLFISYMVLTGQENLEVKIRESILEQKQNYWEQNDSVFHSSNEFVSGKLYYPKGNVYSHPYFINNKWNAGVVYYDGLQYNVEALRYDLHTDQLVYLLDRGKDAYPVAITDGHVDGFLVFGHSFVYIANAGNVLGKRDVSGYFEKVYSNGVSFYVKWIMNETTNQSTKRKEYSPWNLLVLEIDDNFYKIKSENDLCKKLVGFEDEMKSYVKRNKIRINKNDYGKIENVLSHYNYLKNQ